MPSVCFYFQVHQPYRVRRFSYFDSAPQLNYFDDAKNGAIMRKVADKCYLPANAKMLDLIRRHEGRFRISYSITGVAIEQMKQHAPEVLDSFVALAETGCVEFIAETYYHSLSAIFSERDFYAQVEKHAGLMRDLFNQTPRVFRNTELIYDDRIGKMVSSLGYSGVIAEGVDDVLCWRSPHFLYKAPDTETALLLKSYRLSDDIAFRFSNRGWKDFPLTADKYASWLHAISGAGEIVNLFMDYETFGEHQWANTGIFEFLDYLPAAVLRHPDWNFCTVGEATGRYRPVADLSFHRLTSWADMERDLTAWRGNGIQHKAFAAVYELEERVKSLGDEALLDTWRRFQTSDHFYYMCTKWFADGDVHAYFSPFESPYDAFINYMNSLRDFAKQVDCALGAGTALVA